MFKEWIQFHKAEIVVTFIGVAVGLAVALAAGSDPIEAGRNRR